MANPQCKIEQRTKAILPCGIGLDLAANVADDAAKSRAQEFELPPSALELVGMRIAPHHNGRAFGHAQITLAQLDALAFGATARTPAEASLKGVDRPPAISLAKTSRWHVLNS